MRFPGHRYFLFLILINLIGCQPNDIPEVNFWKTTFMLEPVVKDLTVPWDMTYDNEGYIWFTEKIGNVYRLKDHQWTLELIHKFDDVFVSQEENAGLHSMLLHPQWPDSSYLYFHYTYNKKQSKLVRYYFDQEQKKLSEDRVIFNPLHAARSHNGSRMIVDQKGCILFCLGDAYRYKPAQDTNDYSGKVLRFRPDGSIPKDNPFNNHVWTIGHRNPQGLILGENGIIYSSEHGPATDDEINIIRQGGNYGWPNVLGYCDQEEEQEFCKNQNIVEPIWTWSATQAPSGLTYYDDDYFPEWKNSLLQCFLKGGRMHWLPLSKDGKAVENEYRFFCTDFVRIRDILKTPDGRLFLCSSNKEIHKPYSYANDDKIIHVTNLNKNDRMKINFSCDEHGKTFNIRTAKDLPDGQIVIADYIGNPLVTQKINPNTRNINLDWWPLEEGYYFIKLKLIDGKNIQKRFTFGS